VNAMKIDIADVSIEIKEGDFIEWLSSEEKFKIKVGDMIIASGGGCTVSGEVKSIYEEWFNIDAGDLFYGHASIDILAVEEIEEMY
jgi:hypothetical protein